MSLLINAIFKKFHLGDHEKDGAWYAGLKFRTPVHTQEVVEAVQKRSSISEHDALAVISVLSALIPEYLKNGHTVHLDKLGIFSMSVKSKGHDSENDVSAESVKSNRIRFLPAVDMKRAVADAKFIKIEK